MKKIINKKPSAWKHLIAAIVVLLLCIIAGYIYHVYRWYSTIDIVCQKRSEAVIRSVVAEQFGKDPNNLTDDDFAKITELNLYKKELYDIELLEKCYNLRKLSLREISVSEIDPPVLITVLAKFGLVKKQEKVFIDLTPLRNLVDLEVLRINSVPVKFLESLSYISSLRELTLIYGTVSNIEPLKFLTNLQTLSLNGVFISELGPLGNMTSLQNLCIDHTQVRDLKPLQGLTGLQILSLNYIQVSDITPIGNLTNLRHLDIMGDIFIPDLEPIKNLNNLEYLCIADTRISDIEPVKNLKNLKKITLRDCKNINDEQIEELQKALPELKITNAWVSFSQVELSK